MATSWVKAPISVHAASWSTLHATRKVLFVVHTVASANRMLDLVPLFDSDLRVQLVFTCPGSSAISSGVDECLDVLGVVTIPWAQAIHTEWDLAITANTSGNLHELHAPLVVVSHGVGYSKHLTGKPGNRETGKPGNRETGKPVYGLSGPSLLYDGRVVPDVIVLSHDEQLRRLAQAVPAAVDRAVVAGDPRFDRMVASRGRRARYRETLGVADDQELILVSSTWWSRSLFGTWPDLLRQLLAELPVDRYRVAAVLHPHVWQAHSRLQVRTWLADCLRAGLILVPPWEGWSAAVIAADLTIGDHGAVTCYAAAMDMPVLLGAFPEEDVAAGSCVDALGRTAPALDRRRSLLTQVDLAKREYRRGRFDEVTELVSSAPDEAAARLRPLCYRLMGLDEPKTAVLVPVFPADDLLAGTQEPRVAAIRAAGALSGPDSITLTRHPADVMPGRALPDPALPDAHLAVHAEHPMPTLRTNADIVFARHQDVGEPAGRWLDRSMSEHPCCLIAAVVTAHDQVKVRVRGGPHLVLTARGQHAGQDPLAWVSALYIRLTSRPAGDRTVPPAIDVALGPGSHTTVDIRPVD